MSEMKVLDPSLSAPGPGVLPAINGQGLKELVKASLAWLKCNQQAINALNVFPVPDGDTGTNMLLTMESAWAEVNKTPTDRVGPVAHAVAHGALMGARGNSGVILSQLWRGFARSLDDKELLTVADLVPAMQEGAQTAYKGVIKPVEGTILTVAREVSDACTEAAQTSDDLAVILEWMVTHGRESVARTLPVRSSVITWFRPAGYPASVISGTHAPSRNAEMLGASHLRPAWLAAKFVEE